MFNYAIITSLKIALLILFAFWLKLNQLLVFIKQFLILNKKRVYIIQGNFNKGNEFWAKTLNFFPNIFATRCRRPLIFQTMNYVTSRCQSLKYGRFTISGCKDVVIRKFEFVVKTQFFCDFSNYTVFTNDLNSLEINHF